jgi:hypothetical protein
VAAIVVPATAASTAKTMTSAAVKIKAKVSAERIESALKQQTKNLTEHSWQTQALQVYGEQQTDF